MSREESRKRAGRPAQPGGPPVPDSVHRLPGWLAAVLVVGVVECGAGAVERAGYDQLVLAALEQVPAGRGAVLGDVLVDRLADVLGQRDVAELPGLAELQWP